MTRTPPLRIALSIDRITCDRPGLDRAALEAALRREVSRHVAEGGVGALGPGGARTQARVTLAPGKGPIAGRVAAAAVKAVKP